MEDLTYFKTIMPKNSLIWCTEYGINSESEKLTRATEKEQAKHVITATISGIGNGISLFIFAGIIAGLPQGTITTVNSIIAGNIRMILT